MSCIVNCSVFCLMRSKTIFPWTILKVPECELSFAEFFQKEVKGRIPETVPLDLVSASAGKSKDNLDEVDLLLQVESVVSLFGPFIKYRTKLEVQAENVAVATINSPCASPQSQCTRYIPCQRNNKDSLYNQIILVWVIEDLTGIIWSLLLLSLLQIVLFKHLEKHCGTSTVTTIKYQNDLQIFHCFFRNFKAIIGLNYQNIESVKFRI